MDPATLGLITLIGVIICVVLLLVLVLRGPRV